MRTGVSYMGHHNPRHLKTDLEEMQQLGLDDVLVALQENDFRHFVGKLQFIPKMARDLGLRPVAIFWGALNLFGGGCSSNLLLENPGCFQVARDGSHRQQGCYVNPASVARIKEMIATAAAAGYEGYFVDEPVELEECFCPACRARFSEWDGADLIRADAATLKRFRERCVLNYVHEISGYCRQRHPQLETMCCLMPRQQHLWAKMAAITELQNLGADIYWVNQDRDVEEMRPLVREMRDLCQAHGKKHHEWLQCWQAAAGREGRILDQGRILVEENPDALYIWAWHGQVGTTETCANPDLGWAQAVKILKMAKP